MNELISENARRILIPDRRCTATSRDGTRCGRAPTLGATVCNLHGGKTPWSQAAARERLLMLVEPAIGALMNALRSAPPCEVCGRSDSDRDPVVIRAAQLVLDRCGHGPSQTITLQPPENPYAKASDEDLENRIEHLAKLARELRDQGTRVIEEPVHTEPARIPLGNQTPETSTPEPVENTGDPDDV